jgi:hypothetical protein
LRAGTQRATGVAHPATRETVAGLDETVTRLLQAVVRGQLTPAEAKGIAAIVEGKRRIQKRVISSHGFRN